MIVGRCADYALADFPNVVSVFICGDENDKLARMQETYKVDLSKAKDIMIKSDKKRSSYYNYYSDKKWGDGSSYNMCIDSGVCGIDGTVQLIKDFVALKEKIKG